MRRRLVALLLPVSLIAACGSDEPRVEGPVDLAAFQVSSQAFEADGWIPAEFTCDGEDRSPPLDWSNVPADAAELAVLVKDVSAPRGFIHWVVFGIAPGVDGVAAGEVPAGAAQGRNDFGDSAYGGPCPPVGDGPHEYSFRVFALAEELPFDDGDRVEESDLAFIAVGGFSGLYGR